ncbi:MAG TPA: hypothetical protein VGS01_09580 [Candidatus Limnocylindria bacterium]|jgi:hypothetical protein|nr:hypothetical protein [Candidatus Limnocylindria bacterium]
MSEETQKQRVKDLIRSAGPEGLCSIFLYRINIPNGRTRAYELRDHDGLAIEVVACSLEDYHRGERIPAHVRFVGRWWTGNTYQLSLFRPARA